MRICFLAPANSYHTQKWCKWFSEHGHEVHVISFSQADIAYATVYVINSGINESSSDCGKLEYLRHTKEVKRLLTNIKPDFISAHRAPSYGMIAALSGVKNYALSVWGDDIFVFPQKTILHKLLLKYSLYKAPHLLSTSKAMAIEGSKYTKKSFAITPFGVDAELFSPDKRDRDSADGDFIVGTVKALTPKYGIEYILKAVALIKNEYPQIPIKLRIAGKGSHEEEYRSLAMSLGVDGITTLLGFIPQEQAAKEWANMDVGIVASTLDSESFGVSVVEAQACGTPVIISDIPGLMEATSPGQTSIVVPRKNEYAIAEAIVCLYESPVLRKELGESGRRFVVENYELNHCFSKIADLFSEFIGKGIKK